ncbi:hypothetical protein H6G91_11320 [Nostoc muscorum FACHB-395]|jgi:hypothetical protein|nr:hypothetical protein [Desmonostoc muscorum FACHB-395]
MEQDFKQEIQELKSSINVLSTEISQQFRTINENFSINIKQISDQIANLSEIQVLSNKVVENYLISTSQEILQKPKRQINIPNEYFIDYSFIDSVRYPALLENLQKDSKDMAECRHKKQITTFCESARKTLDSSIAVLFAEEFKFLHENNRTFLEAYGRVKIFQDNKENKNYEFPNIYISNTGQINAEGYKKVGNNYISWKKIEEIHKMNLPASVRIFFEMIKPNFYDNSALHLRKKYLTIIDINQLRKLECHGSKDSLKEQIDKLHNRTKQLFSSEDNFSHIQELIFWFVKEVYNRLDKLSTQNN